MNERIERRGMGLKASRTISNTIIYIILVIMSIVWLIPFVCIVLQSFRIESTWQVGYVIPKQWGWNNYIALWNSDFKKWYLNTFIIALVVAVMQTIIVLCMSYTLSRFRFQNAGRPDALHADPWHVPRHADHDHPLPRAEGPGHDPGQRRARPDPGVYSLLRHGLLCVQGLL